jgi:hypothetical protein
VKWPSFIKGTRYNSCLSQSSGFQILVSSWNYADKIIVSSCRNPGTPHLLVTTLTAPSYSLFLIIILTYLCMACSILLVSWVFVRNKLLKVSFTLCSVLCLYASLDTRERNLTTNWVNRKQWKPLVSWTTWYSQQW